MVISTAAAAETNYIMNSLGWIKICGSLEKGWLSYV